MGGNENAGKVFAAAVKLPSFYMMMPSFWFIQAEGQFATKGVEDGAIKFHYVVGALPQDVALRVMPVLRPQQLPTDALQPRLSSCGESAAPPLLRRRGQTIIILFIPSAIRCSDKAV